VTRRNDVVAALGAVDRDRDGARAITGGNAGRYALAGLNPSGVICEIMNEDGTMSRLSDLVRFARLHDLKIGTIRDLIAYRRRHDHLIERRGERRFASKWGGEWQAIAFYNRATGEENLALVKGAVRPDKPTLVRMHALSLFDDVFGEDGARGQLIERSMEIIGAQGAGVIVLINRASSDYVTRAIARGAGGPPADAAQVTEQRDYGGGAQILGALGVHDMILLTNTEHSLVALEGYGLSIVGQRPLD
jgi:3,4-dihydroxy 2-butanone 4-phosphate synthase / GTP cyclohydrolase II